MLDTSMRHGVFLIPYVPGAALGAKAIRSMVTMMVMGLMVILKMRKEEMTGVMEVRREGAVR